MSFAWMLPCNIQSSENFLNSSFNNVMDSSIPFTWNSMKNEFYETFNKRDRGV